MTEKNKDYWFGGEEPTVYEVLKDSMGTHLIEITQGVVRRVNPDLDSPANDCAFVQVVDGKIVAAFTEEEIVFGLPMPARLDRHSVKVDLTINGRKYGTTMEFSVGAGLIMSDQDQKLRAIESLLLKMSKEGVIRTGELIHT